MYKKVYIFIIIIVVIYKTIKIDLGGINLASNEVEIAKNIQQWEEKLIQIFPTAIPNRCVWYDEIDIVNILFTLCYKNLNNIFYPDGQVFNLYGVDFSKENKCIDLITESTVDVIRPTKLSFHFFEDAYSWSYFRLESEDYTFLIFAKESPFKWIYNKSLNLLSEEELSESIEELIPKG